MRCEHCGAEVKEGKFCSFCGSEIIRIEPQIINNTNQTTIINNYYTTQQEQNSAYNRAYPQYMSPPINTYSRKSRAVALLLCLFLGPYGIHCFYVGKVGTGIAYLFTLGLFGIGWFVDLIKLITGTYTDGDGHRL